MSSSQHHLQVESGNHNGSQFTQRKLSTELLVAPVHGKLVRRTSNHSQSLQKWLQVDHRSCSEIIANPTAVVFPSPVQFSQARECWEFMCHGCKLIKMKRSKIKRSSNNKKKQERKGKKKYFVLDEDLMGFRYSPSRKPKGFKVSLSDIKDVVGGHQIAEADRIKKYPRDCQLVILYERKFITRRMHLVAFSSDAASKWVFGLQAVLKRKGLLLSKPDPLRDEYPFYDADKNGALSLSEVEKLLFSLNISIDSKRLKLLFNDANIQGIQGHKDGTLTKEEFADFFKRLSTREEIIELIEKFGENGRSLTVSNLKRFLTTEQEMEGITDHFCIDLIGKYEPIQELKERHLLGIDGLTKYLLSNDGDIIDSKCHSVYQDMSQPLSHYFIASSHNTYLLEDQFRGPSSVKAYENALKSGCRCIELDIWDGDDNQPVIYHGYTLTSKILFKDVISTIKKFAFYSSPYPLILSLENHCSIEQQKVMARYFLEILGDELYTEEVDKTLEYLPSPESLKYKILLKGKKLSPEQEDDSEEDPGMVSEEDEASEIVVDQSMQDEVDFHSGQRKKDEKQKERSKKYSATSIGSFSRSFSRGSKKNLKLAKELSRLVNYIRAVKFQSCEYALEHNEPYEMSSFSESKFESIGESDGEVFVRYNMKFLSRTYPSGRRVDSSNYNPQVAWNSGCQIVALNYQTDGSMMDIYKGKFRDNGNCGYLLKPHFMREESKAFNPNDFVESKSLNRKQLSDISKPVSVELKVISGQQLPKAKNSKQKEVIDPYVFVEAYGLECDEKEKLFCSKTIHNNGFNPVWNEMVKFPVNVPELCLLRFSVYDSDYGGDDFIGQFSIPLTCIRQGWRHLHLLSKQGNPLPNATLFVHMKIRECNIHAK
eukprot:gene7741-8581_t